METKTIDEVCFLNNFNFLAEQHFSSISILFIASIKILTWVKNYACGIRTNDWNSIVIILNKNGLLNSPDIVFTCMKTWL